MAALTQGSHPQLEARQLIQRAAAIVAGCFPALRIQVRAAKREKHYAVREL